MNSCPYSPFNVVQHEKPVAMILPFLAVIFQQQETTSVVHRYMHSKHSAKYGAYAVFFF